MTTSDTTIYSPSWATLMYRSLRMVGAFNADGNPSPEQITDTLDILNTMLKAWAVDQNLWLKTFATVLLNKGQQSYKLGPIASGGDHVLTSYIQTNLTNTAIAGSNTVVLNSAVGMNANDYLGVADDNGVIEWFTATFVGNTATLSGVTAVNASSGNVVYSHSPTAQIDRPTRITTAARKLYDPIAPNGIEVEIMPWGRQEYAQMPNKTIQGKIVQFYYDPQLVAGILNVWPTADTPNDKLVLTVDRPVQILLADTDTFDLPMEWFDAIVFCLAERLWFEYPNSSAEYTLLAQRASIAKESVLGFDTENSSFNYQRDYR